MTPGELRERLAAFAVNIERFTRPMLSRPDLWDAARQLRRSSTSVAANHRAAGCARSRAEFAAKLSIALEEADETRFWLEHLMSCTLGPVADIEPLLTESRQVAAILATSVRTARRAPRRS